MTTVREIILDTETTGLSARNGDRIIEIGCVETFGKVRGKKFYHQYINPERDIPADATRIHGITDAFIADKPVFSEIIDAFLEFIGDDILVAHNASFDVGFLNMELERCGKPALSSKRIIDTVKIARKKYPGARVNLDALCKRYDISLEAREKHGALLDAELLAEVYLYLHGGPQASMFADPVSDKEKPTAIISTADTIHSAKRSRYQTSAIKVLPTSLEKERHAAFIAAYIKKPVS